jgi:hypothetical protein
MGYIALMRIGKCGLDEMENLAGTKVGKCSLDENVKCI